MPYVICKDCKKPAQVARFAKGAGYLTRSLPGHCDCGTDQRRGKSRQDYIENNMKDSIDELTMPQIEPKPAPKPKPEVSLVPEPKPDNEPTDKKAPSKLWWLLIPIIGLGYTFARIAGNKK